MDSWGAAILLGFVLGLRHALDPDHVVAVSTLVARGGRRGGGALLGAAWGLGHTVTIFAAGSVIALAQVAVSPRVEAALEFAVGCMLVVLGTLALRGASFGEWGLSSHEHEHDHEEGHGHHLLPEGPGPHTHAHAHSPALETLASSARAVAGVPGASPGGLVARAFAVGMVHGLAGSGAIALLVLAAIGPTAAALAYLAVFGLGTLAGMTLLSAALECAAAWTARRAGGGPWLGWATGAVSVALGLAIMFRAAV